jgi:hypothetical protein
MEGSKIITVLEKQMKITVASRCIHFGRRINKGQGIAYGQTLQTHLAKDAERILVVTDHIHFVAITCA